MSRFSVENFMSHSAEKFCGGTLLCCVSKKFPVAKKFMDETEGGVSRFSVESFLSHSAATFRRESFSVSLISGIEKSQI